jgi:hypothetical protein
LSPKFPLSAYSVSAYVLEIHSQPLGQPEQVVDKLGDPGSAQALEEAFIRETLDGLSIGRRRGRLLDGLGDREGLRPAIPQAYARAGV